MKRTMSRRDHFMLRKGATDKDMGRARGARSQEEDATIFVCTDIVHYVTKLNIHETPIVNDTVRIWVNFRIVLNTV